MRRRILWLVLLVACDDGHDPSHQCADSAVHCAVTAGTTRDAGRALAVPPAPAPPAFAPASLAPVERPARQSCRIPPPAAVAEAQTTNLGVGLRQPVWVGHADDGSDRLYAIEKCRGIRTFRAGDPDSQVFLALEPACRSELGVLGLAFHPRYADNGRLFVHWTPPGEMRSRISEFRRDATRPNRAVRDSERVILEVAQPFANHNGGDLQFGPDGMLYIALGDGGSGGDPLDHAQRPSTLLGSILRIDVDGATPYAIPPDNPFAACTRTCGDAAAARPEIWAYGLRNPWRMRFDPGTGALWVGDVGQDRREEVDRIVRGGNYGWRVREGERCFAGDSCRSEGLVPPVHTYGRDAGESITGGLVYRGRRLGALRGAYLFADFASGRLWAWRDGAVRQVAETGARIASFGEDLEGEVLLADYDGRILRLDPAGAAPAGAPPPPRLSATGCFSDTARRVPADGVIPYAVALPFWSDGAAKERHLALPSTPITWRRDEPWGFPEGTVFLKTFAFGARPVETRIIARHADGWSSLSYRWAGDDAELVPAAGLDAVVDTPDGPLPWRFPARGECARCHTDAAGFVLGVGTRQLNIGGQLQALAPVLDPQPAADAPAHPGPSAEASSARAWLDVNCAGCHRPGGVANVDLDLRATADLDGLCGAAAQTDDLGIDGARLLVPGDPDRSLLLQRALHRGDSAQMPPLATERVDALGVNALAAWIRGGAGCL